MNRLILSLLAIIIICFAAFLYLSWGKEYVVTLTEEEILAKVAPRFPFKKTYFFLVQLEFTNPRLELEEGSDRIRMGVDVTTGINLDYKETISRNGGEEIETHSEKIKDPLSGTALISGNIRYDRDDGKFYLDHASVEKLAIVGIPALFASKVNEAANKAAAEFLKSHPIYQLKTSDVKQAITKLVLKNVVVKSKTVVITLGIG